MNAIVQTKRILPEERAKIWNQATRKTAAIGMITDESIYPITSKITTIRTWILSNNLRAKPGAFVCEPLKAAFGGANATPPICCRLKAVNQRHRFSCSSR